MKNIKSFAREITWPSAKKVRSNVACVLLFSAMMALFIGAVDFMAVNVVSMVIALS